MNVMVVGAGALGMLFGGYSLLASENNLIVVTRTKLQASTLNQEGLLFRERDQKEHLFKVNAFSTEEGSVPSELLSQVDIVLVTVKQHHLETVLGWLKQMIPTHTPLLFLMNGLGHVEKIQDALSEHASFFGVTYNGATKISTRSVEERGRSLTKVGFLANKIMESTEADPSVLMEWTSQMNKLGITVKLSQDILSDLWHKCIVNSCINPLTGLFQVENGQLIENVHLHRLMRQLYDELIHYVQETRADIAQKILRNDCFWEEIEAVCRNTSNNRSSMEQDIRYGRKTEIDSFNGYFLKEALKKGIHLPTHTFIYHSILFLQKSHKG